MYLFLRKLILIKSHTTWITFVRHDHRRRFVGLSFVVEKLLEPLINDSTVKCIQRYRSIAPLCYCYVRILFLLSKKCKSSILKFSVTILSYKILTKMKINKLTNLKMIFGTIFVPEYLLRLQRQQSKALELRLQISSYNMDVEELEEV